MNKSKVSSLPGELRKSLDKVLKILQERAVSRGRGYSILSKELEDDFRELITEIIEEYSEQNNSADL